VVNDNSTDGTASIASEKGARVINLKELPEGWTGKAYACLEGAKAASGEILVFLDADTVLEDDGLEVLISIYKKTDGFVSAQPYHRMEKPHEKLSAFFNLILFLNMNVSSVIQKPNQARGAFGPCFICRRDDYLAVGGHEAIKGEIIEDMALARAEFAHWLTMAGAPVFLLWNECWAELIMIVYALAVNLPCIIAQRYNRSRLRRLI